jgi:hypothetical protein
MGILNGVITPMGVRPDYNEIKALFGGRYFWIYLLSSFIGSTNLPGYQAGLLGISFLIMTALASSLLIENKWMSIVAFVTVTFNPLLLQFSVLTLNDLVISFYAIFAILWFINSFSKTSNNLSINFENLFRSLLGIVILIIIKLNLIIFISMWIVIVYIIIRYKLYKQNLKYKILLIATILPVSIYELCLDIPYVISVWVLKSKELGSIFGKFLFISPIERLLRLFIAPWWNPAAPTLFTLNFTDYMDYLYRILMPESSSILVSAIILTLPSFIMSKTLRKELDKGIFISLTLLSLWLFYFEAVSSFSLSDASRYALWMMPLWMPLSLMVLQDIRDDSSYRKLLPIFIGALILLYINIWLSKEGGGVYIGYGLPSRLWTADAIIIQLIVLILIMSLFFLKKDVLKLKLAINKKLLAVKTVNLKNAGFCLIMIVILLNEIYFSFQFIEKSSLYKDHGFTKINDSLSNFTINGSLIFANNYIYMRPYMEDTLLRQGLLLPPPDTKEEFSKLLEIAPNNTLFLISNDPATTWYEYANNYIKSYIHSDTIISEKSVVSKLPKFNLTGPVLKMTFDDADKVTIPDHSGFGNNGANYGASIVEGYYGNALMFNGNQYISIPNNDVLNIQNEITISFLALILEAQPLKGYMILSKGYAPMSGSYDVFIFDGKIYFELGNIGYLSFPVKPYLGTWHHFIFSYDGKKLVAYVDGFNVASKPASGFIRISSYDLEIGRDSQRKWYYYIGLIDELQISYKKVDVEEITSCYQKNYASKIKEITLPTGQVNVYSLCLSNNRSHAGKAEVFIKYLHFNVQENLTTTLELQIYSLLSKNISILLATDRFTKVYNVNLIKGLNNVKFHFDYIVDPSWYEEGGFYWLHLTQARIIIIEDNTICCNVFITAQNLKLMNALLLTLLCILLLLYSFSQFKIYLRL